MLIKILLTALLVFHNTEANEFLDSCDTSSLNSTGKNIRFPWLRLGQFYSYCMQVCLIVLLLIFYYITSLFTSQPGKLDLLASKTFSENILRKTRQRQS